MVCANKDMTKTLVRRDEDSILHTGASLAGNVGNIGVFTDKHLVTMYNNGHTVYVWDNQTGVRVKTVKLPISPLQVVTTLISDDGQYVIATTTEYFVYVFDAWTGAVYRHSKISEYRLGALATCGSRLAVSDWSDFIYLVDWKEDRTIKRTRMPNLPVRITMNSTHMVVTTADLGAIVLKDLQIVYVIKDQFLARTISMSGRYLFLGCLDGDLLIYCIDAGKFMAKKYITSAPHAIFVISDQCFGVAYNNGCIFYDMWPTSVSAYALSRVLGRDGDLGVARKLMLTL